MSTWIYSRSLSRAFSYARAPRAVQRATACLVTSLFFVASGLAGGCVTDSAPSETPANSQAGAEESHSTPTVVDDKSPRVPDPFAFKLVQAGRALAAQGDHEDAMHSYAEAIEIDPAIALAHLEWSISAQMASQDPSRIRSAFEKAVRLAPRNPRAHFEQALFHESQNAIDDAIDGYRQTIRLRSESPRARARLGALRLRQGDASAAVESLTIAVKLDPKAVAPRVVLAEAAEAVGDVDLAAKTLGGLSREHPKAITWKRRLVDLYDRAGRKDDAARARRALEKAAPKKEERKLRPLKKRRRRRRR